MDSNKDDDQQQSDHLLTSKKKDPFKSGTKDIAKQKKAIKEGNIDSDPILKLLAPQNPSEPKVDSNGGDQKQSDKQLKASKNHIDFDIFEATEQCTGDDPKNKTTPNLKECSSVKRVLFALKYYMAMTRRMDKEGVSAFTDFIKFIYKNYLNDITHLTEEHGGDLEDIHKSLFTEYGFKPCDLTKCKLSGRHSAVNGTEKGDDFKPNDDAVSQFIVDSFDSVHFYLFHLFDIGLRTLRADIDSEQKEDDEIEDEDAAQSQCVDRAFLRRKKRLKAVRNELTEYLQRFQGEANKFVISGQTGERKQSGNKTYFDRFVEALIDSVDGGERVRRYLMEQHFDTDAIRGDVGRYPNAQNSNILGVLDDDDGAKEEGGRVREEMKKKMGYFVNRRRRTFCCSLNSIYSLSVFPLSDSLCFCCFWR